MTVSKRIESAAISKGSDPVIGSIAGLSGSGRAASAIRSRNQSIYQALSSGCLLTGRMEVPAIGATILSAYWGGCK